MDTRYQSLIKNSTEFLLNPNLSTQDKNNHYKNVGFYYYQLKNKNEAIKWFMKISPKDFSTCKSIAAIYLEKNMLSEANLFTEICLQQQFDFNISYDLALHYTKQCLYHKALGLYETLLDIQPNNINVLNNVSEIYNCIMKPKKAMEYYLKAFELDKKRFDIYSNLIMTSYYIYRYSPVKRLKYTNQYEEMLKTEQILCLDKKKRNTDNLIRIGYIGYDFDKLQHPISCFVKHIIENHDRAKYKVYCYQASDKISSCFQQTGEKIYTNKINGTTTRNLSNHDSKSSANIIYNDQIDVLIELMHHTAGNRLSILSYRPAPIQISYCAFPGTTGLSSIDYKILDNITFTSSVKTFYTEKIIRMNNGFHCYIPTYKLPKNIQKRVNGPVNFCCFNNLKKINEKVIENWLHILRLIPGSQLYLRYYQYTNSFIRELVKKKFIDISNKLHIYKFDINRIHFVGYVTDYTKVIQMYENMDIFLDTFPYTGTTVICEALSMSIPVITLLGKQPHERIGASILSSINHPELIASKEREYIEKAVTLGKNMNIINNYKKILVNDMKKSILGNSKIFMDEFEKKIEEVYQTLE